MCDYKNCPRFLKAQSVVVTTPAGGGEDYLTVTVADTVTFQEGCYCIGLFTTIPTTINCARIVVTNGTDQLDVLKCDGDYWRPCNLKCRSVLRMSYLSDPAHMLIMRRG